MEGQAAVAESPSAAPENEERARANIYSLLGALFAQSPGPEVVALLKSIPEAGEESLPMAAPWWALRDAAHRVTLNQIKDEYHDLFIGVGRGELLPYGSPYLTGFLNDQPLVELREDLTRLGLKRREESREPEDHVAALCEAMAYLASNSTDYDFDDQKRFFEKHLRTWVGQFMNDLQAASSADFYEAVGNFGARFMALEERYFSLKT